RLLDGETCRCRDYANRTARVDDCVRLTADNLASLNWLPPTRAYRPCPARDYATRPARVDDCVRLTADNLASLNWLPPTCAYRLVANGGDLYWWHPLLSRAPQNAHAAWLPVHIPPRA